MRPTLHDGIFVYATAAPDTDLSGITVIATMRETEGITVIAEELEAQRAELPILLRVAWITLAVESSLQAVGFTAAFASALAAEAISCNVVAGAHHDHIFVPIEQASAAMARLCALQASAKPC